jgi:S-formylglutathione hydrolase FrmB
MTSVERYASKLGLAVVMPNGGRSFYHNMQTGMRYQDFIVYELPMILSGFFPFSEDREDNFIAGLSMGGYGSLLIAMTYPGRYSAVASLSGVTDFFQWGEGDAKKNERGLMWQIFGDKPVASLKKSANLYDLSRVLARGAFKRMPIYQCCGTEDFLYQQNVSFRNHLERLGLNLTYSEGPGSHEWGYWDQQIQKVLQWLPLRKKNIPFMEK